MKYNSLKKAEKRKEVGKDLLERINTLKFNTRAYVDVKESVRTSSLKEILKTYTCKVCAIGATLTSVVRLNGDIHYSDVNTISSFCYSFDVSKMLSIFKLSELFIMEMSFCRQLYIENSFAYKQSGLNFDTELLTKQSRMITRSLSKRKLMEIYARLLIEGMEINIENLKQGVIKWT